MKKKKPEKIEQFTKQGLNLPVTDPQVKFLAKVQAHMRELGMKDGIVPTRGVLSELDYLQTRVNTLQTYLERLDAMINTIKKSKIYKRVQEESMVWET